MKFIHFNFVVSASTLLKKASRILSSLSFLQLSDLYSGILIDQTPREFQEFQLA